MFFPHWIHSYTVTSLKNVRFSSNHLSTKHFYSTSQLQYFYSVLGWGTWERRGGKESENPISPCLDIAMTQWGRVSKIIKRILQAPAPCNTPNLSKRKDLENKCKPTHLSPTFPCFTFPIQILTEHVPLRKELY